MGGKNSNETSGGDKLLSSTADILSDVSFIGWSWVANLQLLNIFKSDKDAIGNRIYSTFLD